MHDYNTILGVIELRLSKVSYDSVQKRYRIGRSGIALIMNRYKDSGLSLDDLRQMPASRVSDLSEVENGKLYNLKEKLLSQNPKCRTCKVNPFCWNCIATIKENTENGAMDDYCSKVKAFYFNTVWGE
jgi:radical SAM protein with 4Fe4S-binding SPASM domain